MGGLVDSLGGQLLGSGLGNFGSLLNPSTGPNAGITSMLGGLADKSNLPINFENFGIGTGIDGLGANYPSNVVFNPSAKKNEYGLKDSARKALIEVAVKLPDLTITVTSTFRSEAHNKDADGAEKSQHIQGRAIDVSVGGSLDNRVALAQAISTTGSVRGWGVYSSGSMHFDTRPGGKAYWSDDFGSGSFDRFAKNGTIEKEISSLVYAWHGGKIPPSTDVIDLDSFLTSGFGSGGLGGVMPAIMQMIGSLFSNDDNDEVYAELPGTYEDGVLYLPISGDKFRLEDIETIEVITNPVDMVCTGSRKAYSYTLAYEARDSRTTTDVVTTERTTCGDVDTELSYAVEIARYLEQAKNFETLDPIEVLEIIDFLTVTDTGSDSDDDTGENTGTTTEESTDSANINFEAKVIGDDDSILQDWTSDDLNIPNTSRLYLRWDAAEYTQCLPYLADNGQYTLQNIDNPLMLNGNTEDEGFNVPEKSGPYIIQCSDADGVDSAVINITINS